MIRNIQPTIMSELITAMGVCGNIGWLFTTALSKLEWFGGS